MAGKYHINKHGVPAPCRAKEGNCPLGGDTGRDNHYDTIEEAQEEADRQGENKHGFLPGVDSITPYNPTMSEFKELNRKEVSVKLKDGSTVDGLVYKANHDGQDGSMVVKTRDGQENISVDDIEDVEASENPYYSKEHKELLRKAKKPQHEFRYSTKELDSMKGNYVQVDYDGKKFEGLVVDTHNENGNDGLIIESEDGSFKHIKTYRLNELETVGKSEEEFKSHKQMSEFTNNMKSELENFDEGTNEGPDGISDPDDAVNEYFEAVIKSKSGEDIDLSKYNNDFVDEVSNNQDSYYEMSGGSDGGLNETWSINSEEAFDEDLEKAAEVNQYYEGRKDYIDNVAKQAESVDWTKYGKSQKQGEIDALNHVYNEIFDN